MRVLIAFFVCAVLSQHCFAEIINVPDDVETIQEAINASDDGDTVLVQPGEYFENINFSGKAITIASLYLTTNDEAFINTTIIDADGEGPGVTFASGEDNNSILTGFSILNGSGIEVFIDEEEYSHGAGGGILINESSPIINSCRLFRNYATDAGGGIFLLRSEAQVNNCIIDSNTASFEVFGDGGGIYCLEGTSVFTGCSFTSNISNLGGAVFCENSEAVFSECVFTENVASVAGGGAFVEGGSRFEGCIFRGNSATGEGRWVYGSWGGAVCGDAQIANCEFSGNWAGAGGGIYTQGQVIISFSLFDNNGAVEIEQTNGSGAAVFADSGGVSIFRCDFLANGSENGGVIHGGGDCDEIVINSSIIWNNWSSNFGGVEPVVTYSDVQDGFEGVGNIDEDPQFTDSLRNDYRLAEDSPCIDSGDPEADEDPDGTRADMGALFFHQRDIDVEPDHLIFQPISPDEIDSLALIITNVGLTPLTIHRFDWSPNESRFETREEDEFVIEHVSEYLTWIFFIPDQVGTYESDFLIISDDPDEGEIRIMVTGSALSVESENQFLPTEFEITGIYPNPFNSTTTIEYAMPFVSEVSLNLYNLSGQRIETLVNGRLQAGVHHVTLNAGDLPSGLYFVKLEGSGQSFTRKIMLLK